MDLTDDERDLILRSLSSSASITHVEDETLRRQTKALAARLGGDPEAMFYRVRSS
jgi:hypothetical protein